MVIRKFVAETFVDACQRIKEELGPDAMIIQTAKVKVGGFLGLFGRWMYEVTAQAAPQPAVTLPLGPVPTAIGPVPPFGPAAPPPIPAPPPSNEYTQLKAELDDLKKKIDLLVTPRLAPSPAVPVESPPRPQAGPIQIESLTPPTLAESMAMQQMMEILSTSELEAPLKSQIKGHLLETTPMSELESLRSLKDRVVDYLSRSLVTHQGIHVAEGQKAKAMAVIGPTGAGKTTTLAKLGAGLKLNLNLDVVFLTLDTFRMGAPEQLKKYGEILEVPVEVVFRPENLLEAIQSFSDKHVILIDTAGRSCKNRPDMLDLRRFLDCGYPVETCLVLAANTKYSDLVDAVECFKEMSPTNLIVTKLDETSSFGSMISLLARFKKGVSYVTTGQSVPEDIMPASPARLARFLFEKRLGG